MAIAYAAQSALVLVVVLFCGESRALAQSTRQLLVACQTAPGSQGALDSLSKLRALGEAADVKQAVQTCNDHYQSLRAREDAQWGQALAARDRGDCPQARSLLQALLSQRTAYQLQARNELNALGVCGPSASAPSGSSADDGATLQRATGFFNAKNFAQARPLLQSLESRPGGIGEQARKLLGIIITTEANNRRFQDANIAITRKQLDRACQLLAEIEAADPGFANLAGSKARAGGCAAAAPPAPPAPPALPSLASQYDRAVALVGANDLAEARVVLGQIRSRDPKFRAREVADLFRRIDGKPAPVATPTPTATSTPAPNPPRDDRRFAQLETAVEASMSAGDYRAAHARLLAAAATWSADRNFRALRERVERAVEEEEAELLEGLNAFYAGRYAQAEQALRAFLERFRAPSVSALATFYLAATVVSDYHLRGVSDEATKAEAAALFNRLRKDHPTFKAPWHAVSPKVKAAADEAAAGSR